MAEGYPSFAHTAAMTPGMADDVRAGRTPEANRITFYDEDGRVLVDDRAPVGSTDAELTVPNFPSLAWWLR